jgi:hypothetical protein
MLNSSEFPSVVVESSLSDVLETTGEHLSKYSLSSKAAQGILRRSSKGKGQLPQHLKKSLENVVGQEQESSE